MNVTTPPKMKDITKEKKSRFISEFIDRADIRDFVDEANRNYLYWDEIRYKTLPPGTDAESIWVFMKLNRSPIEKIKISDIEGFTFSYILLNRFLPKLHEFDLHLGGSIGEDSFLNLNPTDKERQLMNSLIEEAIASSQLEGAATTRRVAKEMILTARKPVNKHEKMILNNYRTIKKLAEWRENELTPERIFEIHASITKDTLEDNRMEGKIRTTDDLHVIDLESSEIAYTPPESKHLEKLMQDFCKFANNNSNEKFIHPVIKASILHFLMGYIHPFVDGNGRTARAIFYWYLLKKEYWLLEFTSISRTILKAPTKYAKAYLYAEKDDNDLTYFIDYQLNTLDSALNDFKAYCKRKIEDNKKLYLFEKIKGINHRQVMILNEFSENPDKSMGINELKNKFNIVYQTARTDLITLAERGFLEMRTMGKKKLIFFRSKDFKEIIKKETA